MVAVDVATRDDGTGEHALLEEAEAQHGCLADVEVAVGACLAVRRRRRRAVGGVAQGCACGDADVDGEGFGEEARVGVHLRCFEPEVSEVAVVVRCSQRGLARPSPFLAAVLLACPRAAGDEFGIVGRG